MSERIHAIHVGAPDPELHNSPILEESADDDQAGADTEGFESAHCHFNDAAFEEGALVCSGDELLKCQHGMWLSIGSCDPDNP
ncbi:MAG: hypothetical protein GQ470_02515 [Gammaproteobacteria bacterium]|nr:hypothetical protein [Gammaproteobacteria bacterium]